MPVSIVEDPLDSVAKGTEILLDEIDLLEKIKANNEEYF
jgi:actin-like ATPase involved in cell morphogenesis